MPRVIAFAIAAMMLLSAQAQAQVRLLRDADIEYALRQLAKPILSAAGLNASQVKILLVDHASLNAFVTDTQHIFIHSGLIGKLDSAKALQAVIAHEAAHIANGHLSRRRANMRNARTAANLGLALAAAGAAAGQGEIATGIALGSQRSAQRQFLSHTRAEEAAADISSVRYLQRAGVDPEGAVEVQEIFRGQELLTPGRQDPYLRSHPLSRERLRALKGLVLSAKPGSENPTAEYWYARARGKLTAYKRAPSWTLRRLKDSPTQDIALLREAVAQHRQSNTKKALSAIDKAIALRPKDPFLYDMKAQILLESRQFKAAVQAYQHAVKLAPRNANISGGLGRAQLATGQYKAALKSLETSRGRDVSDARVLRDLAVVYAKLGKPALASLASAERFALTGRLKDAGIHAKRAADRLPQGSAPWQRAMDVLHAAKQAK
jgi:predicted Zn-dependent protease